MKVIIKGAMDVEQLAKKLIEVAEHTVQKAQQDNEGLQIKGYQSYEAEVTFKFDIEGLDEPQVMTVTHHEGMNELFTWVEDVEESDQFTNEDSSLYDVWSVATAQGKEMDFAEIKSVYEKWELELDTSEAYGDMSKKVYSHKDGFKVVKVYQKGRLVQEYKLVPEETTVL